MIAIDDLFLSFAPDGDFIISGALVCGEIGAGLDAV
jgi:hypothetical protein